MKKRKEHATPLPEQAVAMLRALHGIIGRHAYVFPGRDDRAEPMAAASFRKALNVLGWSGKYSPHAMRTTSSTRLKEMGYPADWIERQLANAEPNAVRRTYNHAERQGRCGSPAPLGRHSWRRPGRLARRQGLGILVFRLGRALTSAELDTLRRLAEAASARRTDESAGCPKYSRPQT